MLRVTCPQCKGIHIDRINRDVVIYEPIYVEEGTGYVIEGGVEKPYTYMEVCRDDKEPPHIEEVGLENLEFTCSDCGYFFEDCRNDEDFVHNARTMGLIRWCV